MSYINFKPSQLTNTDYATSREIIRTNRAGAYISTTLNGCNTRKYHGLLICALDPDSNDKHVLLSQLDESILQRGNRLRLSTRRYENGYYDPLGNKYLHRFEYDKIPRLTYKAGGVVLSKERLLVSNRQQFLIRYTLEDAKSPTKLQLQPFLAFRNIHSLSQANSLSSLQYHEVENGLAISLYEGYPLLFMQVSKPIKYTHKPDWHYRLEYTKEKERGYDYLEDLLVSGSFEIELEKGESVIFSASLMEEDSSTLKRTFATELSKRTRQQSITDSLKNAATQFIWLRGDKDDIIAGFPWYNSLSRQTFVALPGLRLTQSNRQLGISVLNSYLPYLHRGLLPESITDKELKYESADLPLWFIWSIQMLKKQGIRLKQIQELYGEAIFSIVQHIRDGNAVVNMLENGLLFSANEGKAHTWMNSYAWGRPVVARYGMPVELNALWYNAVNFAIELAKFIGDSDFIAAWKPLVAKIGESFIDAFWSADRSYLADVYNGFYTDWSVRPNMVIAAAMEYTPLNLEQQKLILDTVTHQLLTSRGLRTLSPSDPNFSGMVAGSVDEREAVIHSGAVHPWLLQFYAEAYLRVHRKSGVAHIRRLIAGFREEMTENCLGTVSEFYDGNPPHTARGAVSQAWNIAALLYANQLANKLSKTQGNVNPKAE